VGVQLQEQAADVRFRGRGRDVQALADLGVRPASGHLGQDLPLPGREGLEQLRRGVWAGLGAAGELADQAAGDARGQQRIAVGQGADRRQQFLGCGVLEQEPAGAGPQRAVDVVVEPVRPGPLRTRSAVGGITGAMSWSVMAASPEGGSGTSVPAGRTRRRVQAVSGLGRNHQFWCPRGDLNTHSSDTSPKR
jgi:hypothetical protein